MAEKTPLKWKFKIEGDFRSSPAVSEGVVYIGSNDRQVPSTYHLYAMILNIFHLKNGMRKILE